jgi:hypothetical protein
MEYATKMAALVVRPSLDVIRVLSDHFQGAPIQLRPADDWYIPVMTFHAGPDGMIPMPITQSERRYLATPTGCSRWYNNLASRTDLVLTFESVEFVERTQEMGAPAIRAKPFHMVICFQFSSRSHNQNFAHSIDGVMRRLGAEAPFVFGDESFLVNGFGDTTYDFNESSVPAS